MSQLLSLESIPALQAEVRALAAERDAVILAHNYQLPEVQDVADYVGDSLGLSRQAAKTDASVVAFCGVHFMAETASVLSPDKRVLHPRPRRGMLAGRLDRPRPAPRLAGQAPRRDHGHVRQHDRRDQGAHRLLRDVLQRRRGRAAHPRRARRGHRDPLRPGDTSLGSYVAKTLGLVGTGRFHVWDGECHVHAGIRPDDIADVREAHPGADFLIHPECGCSTSVMEYVAAGDVEAEGVHMLSTGGMLDYAASHKGQGGTVIMATETGMLHPLKLAAPDVEFIAANERASCRYMKMITLPKLRDCLRDLTGEVRVPPAIAERARVPIERMVAIG